MIVIVGPMNTAVSDSAKWTGRVSPAASIAGTRDRPVAMKPFMSAEPRPCRRPSRSVSVQGSLLQSWPSTGTTSVCPDSTTPPATSGPMENNKFALPPCAAAIRVERTPSVSSHASTASISARLELREVVSNATSRASHARAGGIEGIGVEGIGDRQSLPCRCGIPRA